MLKNIEPTDLSNVMPKGAPFTIGRKKYELIIDFRTLQKLSECYGSVDAAMTEFFNSPDKYNVVLNFLYAGLAEKYKLKKQDIEEWIGLGSVNLLYDLILSAVTASFGTDGEKTDGESEPGEA